MTNRDKDQKIASVSHLTLSRLPIISKSTADTSAATDLVAAMLPTPTPTAEKSSTTDPLDSSLSSMSVPPPLKGKHFIWQCMLMNPAQTDSLQMNTCALIDSRAHMVLIRPDLVTCLQLPSLPLPQPERIAVAIDATKRPDKITHYISLQPSSTDGKFQSKPLLAVITPGLCVPIILGLPFLTVNKVICNYAEWTCMVMNVLPPYDLLNTNDLHEPRTPQPWDVLAAIQDCIITLSKDKMLAAKEANLRACFAHVFEPPPHITQIRLKDPNKGIKTRNYPCPQKWKEAWHTLLQQHLDAGQIRLSSALAGSGAFIIPKADPTVLPRWVNDYRQLNSNTITDSFPIPHINDILTDIATGQIFGQIDMTNSFFQTCMHPDDVGLTAVNTP